MKNSLDQINQIVRHLDTIFFEAKRGKLKSPPWIKDPRIRDKNVQDLSKYLSITHLLQGILCLEELEVEEDTKTRLSELNSLLFTSCYKLFSMENSQHPRLIRLLHSVSHIDGPILSFLSKIMFFTKTSLILDIGYMIGSRKFSKQEQEIFLYLVVNRLDFLSKSDYSIANLKEHYRSSLEETKSLERFYLVLSEAVLLAFVLYISSLVLPLSSKRLCRMKIRNYLAVCLGFEECLKHVTFEREVKSLVNFYTESKPFYKVSMKGLEILQCKELSNTSLVRFIDLIKSINFNRWTRGKNKEEINIELTNIVLDFVYQFLGIDS